MRARLLGRSVTVFDNRGSKISLEKVCCDTNRQKIDFPSLIALLIGKDRTLSSIHYTKRNFKLLSAEVNFSLNTFAYHGLSDGFGSEDKK